MSDGNSSASYPPPAPETAPGRDRDAGPSLGSGAAFQTLHVHRVREDLLSLYERVACEKGRVEIVGGEGGCACVLISKAELDGLEEAIEMLSDGDGVKALRETLAQFAAVAEE